MRMARKSLQDPPRRFRGPDEEERLPFGRKPGPKKAVNVSIDAELLKVAKETGVNISQVTENALRRATEAERIRRFREEHHAALESYDRLIERAGVCGAELYEDDFDADPAV
jgi:antitoxin CcdA